MLEAKNIGLTISDEFRIEGVSFSLPPGTITSVIGQNGAGKSVLLKMLALVERPDTGRMAIDNQQFEFPYQGPESNIDGLRPNLSFVFQQLFLWPHLTVHKNIHLSLDRAALDSSHIDYVNEVIDLLEIRALLNRYPNELSGGQKQRVAIARALVLKPRWLLLDEPTSALDLVQIKQLEALLIKLRSDGVGIVLVTHYMGLATRLSDRVLFLDRGKLIEEGTTSILSQPKTPELMEFLQLLEVVGTAND